MDLPGLIAELRRELQILDEAIGTLSRLAANTTRRGRPPKWMQEARRKTTVEVHSEDKAAKAVSQH